MHTVSPKLDPFKNDDTRTIATPVSIFSVNSFTWHSYLIPLVCIISRVSLSLRNFRLELSGNRRRRHAKKNLFKSESWLGTCGIPCSHWKSERGHATCETLQKFLLLYWSRKSLANSRLAQIFTSGPSFRSRFARTTVKMFRPRGNQLKRLKSLH